MIILLQYLFSTGSNMYGKLGQNIHPSHTVNTETFNKIKSQDFFKMKLSQETVFAINYKNQLFSWGKSMYGGFNYYEAPSLVPFSEKLKILDFDLSDNIFTAYDDQKIYILGNFNSIEYTTPLVLEGSNFTSVSCSNYTAFLIDNNSQVFFTGQCVLGVCDGFTDKIIQIPRTEFTVTKIEIIDNVIYFYSNYQVYILAGNSLQKVNGEYLQYVNQSFYLSNDGNFIFSNKEIDTGVQKFQLTTQGATYIKNNHLYIFGVSVIGELGFIGTIDTPQLKLNFATDILSYQDYSFAVAYYPPIKVPWWGYIIIGVGLSIGFIIGLAFFIVWLKKTGKIRRYPFIEEKVNLIEIERGDEITSQCVTREHSVY